VLAIRKSTGEMSFNPTADAKVTAGDHLIAMGEPKQLRKLEQLLTGAA
jgi:K+/H+ antiporter YhaU regulatory subunit KhtT